MISFYILSKRFFMKRIGLYDARVASITKKEHVFAVQLLQRFIKSLELISDELFMRFVEDLVCLEFSLQKNVHSLV